VTSVVNYLSNQFGQAFNKLSFNPEYGKVVVSDRLDLAQFQCNGAMVAAKQAAQNPRVLAQCIIDNLSAEMLAMCAQITLAGPGFINIILKDQILSEFLQQMYASATLNVSNNGHGHTIILDYGGPNVAKSMHVGHLRSAIIGESLKRAYKFAGFNTISDIHLGDWGTQMGMVISELALRQPDLPYFDEHKKNNFPTHSPLSIADLEIIYPRASQDCKNDPARLELAKSATVKLQHGHPGYRALWQHLVNISIEQIRTNFKALNVNFDLWDGESTVHDDIAPIIKLLEEQHLAEESNGALVIHLQTAVDKETVPPLILYKQDGAVMYGTTDLVTVALRVTNYNPHKIIYIVDKRQSLHFEQVFRAVRKTHLAPDNLELVFVGHGTMNGTDGKPFKTRAGGVMKLEDLIQSSIDKAVARMQMANITNELSVAHKVAISAIKFADLQNNPGSDYIFDLDRMISFEGKTGPYLLYQAVRIKSLLDKAHWNSAVPANIHFATEHDRNLGLFLLNFEHAIYSMLSHHAPHILADYLYKLAQLFSSFYASYQILAENNVEIKISRLFLVALTLKQLTLGLNLLGIDIPDKM